MSNANAIRAGKAFVELFADNTKLVRGLRLAERQVTKFGRDVRSVGLRTFAGGAAGVAAIAGMVKLYTDMGDGAGDAAERTGMTAEAFSTLAYAAKMAEVETEDFEKSLKLMQRTLGKAAGGSKQSRAAFEDIGLTLDDLAALRPEQQFALIAEKISLIKNPAQRVAAAMQIFGRSGAALLPLLNGGSGAIRQFAQEARALGLVMSTQDATAAGRLDDTLKRLWLVIKRVGFEIGKAVAPEFERFALWVIDAAVKTAKFIREIRHLVVTALEVSVAVATVGAALVAFGYACIGAGAALGFLGTTFTIVAGLASAVAAVWGFLASPIGLVVAVIAAVAAVLLNVTGIGVRMGNALRGTFVRLAADFQATFGGMADALRAGDLALAGKILWLALKMEWIRGLNWITNLWDTAWTGFKKMAVIVWSGILVGWLEICGAIGNGWDNTVDVMARGWENFTIGLYALFQGVKAIAQEAWNFIQGIWDKSFDVKAANAAVEESMRKAIGKATGGVLSDRAAREGQAQKNRADRSQAIDDAEEGSLRARVGLDVERDKRVEGRNKEFDAARSEWQNAVIDAKLAAFFNEPKHFRQAKENAGQAPLEVARGKGEARAGFNATNLLGFLVNNSVAERTAAAGERTARNTERLVRQGEGADAEFE